MKSDGEALVRISMRPLPFMPSPAGSYGVPTVWFVPMTIQLQARDGHYWLVHGPPIETLLAGDKG